MKIKIKHNDTLIEINDEAKGVIYTDIIIMKIIKETIDEIIKLKQ
jgi:hypothetical protein